MSGRGTAEGQLRPRSAAELFGLLALCQAAVTCPQLAYPAHPTMTSLEAPTGLAHFVKSRHGPFFNVMSILTKLRGRESPAYWDVFCECFYAGTRLCQTWLLVNRSFAAR